MAGTLYLGRNKVCPAILVGNAEPSVLSLFDVVDGALTWKSSIDGSGIEELNDNVIRINGHSILSYNNNIEEIYLPDLRIINNTALYMGFYNCQNLSVINLQSLESVGNNGLVQAFGFTAISNISFENLLTVGSNAFSIAFYRCPSLDTVRFESLNYIGQTAFETCFFQSSVKHIYFNALKSDSFYDNGVFDEMLYAVTGCTVHFPSNLSSVIGSWSSVRNGFYGTNTTVLFDLPETE